VFYSPAPKAWPGPSPQCSTGFGYGPGISAVATIIAVFIAFVLGYFFGSSQINKKMDTQLKQQSSGEIDKSNKLTYP
jgi:hypothetical protein